MLQLLQAASHDPATARRFADGFADPASLDSRFTNPAAAARYLAPLQMTCQ
jgi:hypothetical protein